MKITPEQMRENNEHAIRIFYENDFNLAENLFQQNARDYPSHITYNNLSWFYYDNDDNKAFRFCRKALHCQRTATSLRNLRAIIYWGGHFFKPYKLKKMLSIQKEVMRLSNDPVDAYIMGALLFHDGQYKDALGYLKKSCAEIDNKDITKMQVVYSLCLSYLGSREKAGEIAQKLLDTYLSLYKKNDILLNYDADPVDIVYMLYCCGDYEQLCRMKDMLSEHLYAMDPDTFAMILYSFKMVLPVQDYMTFKTGFIADYFRDIQELYKGSVYRSISRRSKNYLSKIDSGLKPDIPYHPYYPYRCGFYGCPVHGTPYPAHL